MPTPPSLDPPLPISATVSAEAPVRAHRPSDFGERKDRRRPKSERAPPSDDSAKIIGWCPTCHVGLTHVPCHLCYVRALKAADRKKFKGSQ